jgi:hypothetical protein
MFRQVFPVYRVLQHKTTLVETFANILSPSYKQVSVTMDHRHDSGIQHRVQVFQQSDRLPLGNMEYLMWDDHVYIHTMRNTSNYRHVGTFLHEYAFRQSVANGKQGNVRLHAIDSSHYFHFMNGFRPYPVTEETTSFKLEQIEELQFAREAYLANPQNKTAEKKIWEVIRKNHLEETLKQNTQAKLARPSTAPVTTSEMMQHGFFKTKCLTQEWEEKFAAMPKDKKKDTSMWARCDMYYPLAAILQKKAQFGLLPASTADTSSITAKIKLK